jgi:hypothetical protein
MLEHYFREKIATTENLSSIGSYWESGNQNEIDIVAINDYEKRVMIAEVKRQKKNINLNILREKSSNIIQKFQGYEIVYKAFSIENM